MAASIQPVGVLRFCLMLTFLRQSLSMNDRFDEELLFKPLDTGHLYAQFQFTTKWNVSHADSKQFTHYHLFPKPLGEVLVKFSVQELHLTLSQGVWRHSSWGYPVFDAPPGAELWVWFQEGLQNVDKTWAKLINVLSGMFCASLNYMDGTATVSPKFSFRPQGVASSAYNKKSKLLRYAALPRENVCTENLTPWKKLLPCNSHTGLGTLFNALKLHESHYHSLGLHFRPVCQDASCTATGVELSQNLAVVFEPTPQNGKKDWSIKTLFDRFLGTSCPLASSSTIFVDITRNKSGEDEFALKPEPSQINSFKRGENEMTYAVYNVPEFVQGRSLLNVEAQYKGFRAFVTVAPPIIHAHRFLTGYGQQTGGVLCQLYNTHPTQPLTVVYMETVPWYLRVFLHTLKISTNGTNVYREHQFYQPGRDRERPYHLELVFTIPPMSTVHLAYQFERALLKWTEYPPDANHGFYVNSAVISTVIHSANHYTSPPQDSAKIVGSMTDKSDSFFVRIHTESLLVSLPTPDFSMPYNVICLACTVVAIAFGSIHNLTTRRLVAKDPNTPSGLLGKLKAKFVAFKNSRKNKKPAEVEVKPETQDSEDSTKDDGQETIKEESVS